MVGMFLDLRHEEMSAGISTRLNESNTTAVFVSSLYQTFPSFQETDNSRCIARRCFRLLNLSQTQFHHSNRLTRLFHIERIEGPRFSQHATRRHDRRDSRITSRQTSYPQHAHFTLSLRLLLPSSIRAGSESYVFETFSTSSFPLEAHSFDTLAARRANGASILPFLRNLWSVLDQIHNAVQRLQQHLVNLTSAPAGYADDPQAIDHAILLAVRADNSLVDLIMLIHVHLREKYTHSTFWPEKDGDEELERMRAESSMRVYKCLKLLA